MNSVKVTEFEESRHLQACIRARKWDEVGTDSALATPGFDQYRQLLENLAIKD